MKIIVPISAAFIAGASISYVLIPSDSNVSTVQSAANSNPASVISQSDSNFEMSRSGGVNSGIKTLKMSGRVQGLVNEYDGFTTEDFEAASLELEKLPFHEQMEASILLYSAWAEKDPEGALAFIEEGGVDLNRGSKFLTKSLIYSIFGENDPEAAAAALAESGDIRNRSQRGGSSSYAGRVAEAWAQKDPEAALDWVASLSENQRRDMLPGYMRNLYEQDPELAYEQISNLPEGDQAEAIKGFASVWGEEEQWNDIKFKIDGLPEDIQDEATFSALRPFSRENPYEAQEIISELESGSRTKNSLVYTVVDTIGDENPQETLDWAVSNSTGRTQEWAARELFSPWSREEPDGAAQWLLSQPQSRLTDGLINRLIQQGGVSEENVSQLEGHRRQRGNNDG